MSTLDSTVSKILGVGLDIDSSGHYHKSYREALVSLSLMVVFIYGRAIDD